MSVEHRRQLLAFFIVALAAILLIGNGLHTQFGRGNGSTRTPAAIAAIAAGPTISSGPSAVDRGGSARGTTAIKPAASPASSDRTTSVTSSSLRAAPGHSSRAPRSDRAVQRAKSPAQKQATKRSARPASDDQVTARSLSTGGKKAHAKKHGKKAHKHHRHSR